MDKELLVRLATGFIAKLLRYAISTIGGGIGAASVTKDGVNLEQLAAGIATVAVSIGWSVWEDRVKKAQSNPQPQSPTSTP